MPTSAFFAVLRDVTKMASAAADDIAVSATKLSAAADDVITLSGKATAKTAGVVGDDLAVGAGQVSGISPARELPVIWRISRASFLNKLWLSAILVLMSEVAPIVITIALLLGALYLCYEGAEGILERFHPSAMDSEFQELSEDQKVKGAITTDLILSLEILVISLSAASPETALEVKAMLLLVMSAMMTAAVYGLVALLVRLDDIGLGMARGALPGSLKHGLGIRVAMATPKILKALGPIGIFAMLAVGGGIFTHVAHLEISWMPLALAVDVGVGLAFGLALALAHYMVLKLNGKSSGCSTGTQTNSH